MTWEEAIKFLGQYIGNDCYTEKCQEAHRMAISALRAPTREQVEKVWKGEWEYVPETLNTYSQFKCTVCGWWTLDPSINGAYHYCPNCGAAQTDEAVEIVMERLEALKDGETD